MKYFAILLQTRFHIDGKKLFNLGKVIEGLKKRVYMSLIPLGSEENRSPVAPKGRKKMGNSGNGLARA